MQTSKWWLIRGDRRSGPFKSKELRMMANNGQLLADDLLWKQGMNQPLPAALARHLFDRHEKTSGDSPDLGSPEESDSTDPPTTQQNVASPQEVTMRVNQPEPDRSRDGIVIWNRTSEDSQPTSALPVENLPQDNLPKTTSATPPTELSTVDSLSTPTEGDMQTLWKRRSVRRIVAAISVFLILWAASRYWPRSPFELAAVAGHVTFDGNPPPVKNIRITFHPLARPRHATTTPPVGWADPGPNGVFSHATTRFFGDGLVVGRHKVTLGNSDGTPLSAETFPKAYLSVDHTPLIIDTRVQPIEIRIRMIP